MGNNSVIINSSKREEKEWEKEKKQGGRKLKRIEQNGPVKYEEECK